MTTHGLIQSHCTSTRVISNSPGVPARTRVLVIGALVSWALFVQMTASSSAFAQPISCTGFIHAYPPVDHAIGNAGGDPYAFHVFNREEELAEAKRAHDACAVAPAQ